eukprot:Skav220311  [mRNA]  locus=scaffold525:69951:70877:+ [translate_table: standard]
MASPVRSIRSAKARAGKDGKVASPKKKPFHFKLGAGDDDALSPKLMQLPEGGAFSGFFGSALMPPNEEAAGRFCTEAPKLEFGGPMSQADSGDVNRVPLRQFAVRLQSAIAQAATLLMDRHQSLTKQSPEFTATQDEEMMKLSYGVQAASYNVQKWAAALGHGDGPAFRPPAPQSVEEALAMMNMALPRLVVASSNLQAGLRELVPPTAAVFGDHMTEEELQEAAAAEKQEAEQRAEEELNRLGIAMDELYSILPHMEHCIYQASCLLNSVERRGSIVGIPPPPPPPPVVTEAAATAYEASEPVPPPM